MDNYSTSFSYLDTLFGTDKKYNAYRAKQRAEKAEKNAEGKSVKVE
jgi:methylsterol monooxygenase